jgi:hypothetical protein
VLSKHLSLLRPTTTYLHGDSCAPSSMLIIILILIGCIIICGKSVATSPELYVHLVGRLLSYNRHHNLCGVEHGIELCGGSKATYHLLGHLSPMPYFFENFFFILLHLCHL